MNETPPTPFDDQHDSSGHPEGHPNLPGLDELVEALADALEQHETLYVGEAELVFDLAEQANEELARYRQERIRVEPPPDAPTWIPEWFEGPIQWYQRTRTD